MLPVRDSFQPSRHAQTESEGIEKAIPSKGLARPSVVILKPDKIKFKLKMVTRDKEGYYVRMKRLIQQENTTVANI